MQTYLTFCKFSVGVVVPPLTGNLLALEMETRDGSEPTIHVTPNNGQNEMKVWVCFYNGTEMPRKIGRHPVPSRERLYFELDLTTEIVRALPVVIDSKMYKLNFLLKAKKAAATQPQEASTS